MKRIGNSENSKVTVPEKKPSVTKELQKPIIDSKTFHYYYTEIFKDGKERE